MPVLLVGGRSGLPKRVRLRQSRWARISMWAADACAAACSSSGVVTTVTSGCAGAGAAEGAAAVGAAAAAACARARVCTCCGGPSWSKQGSNGRFVSNLAFEWTVRLELGLWVGCGGVGHACAVGWKSLALWAMQRTTGVP